jgi:hypothetical protein
MWLRVEHGVGQSLIWYRNLGFIKCGQFLDLLSTYKPFKRNSARAIPLVKNRVPSFLLYRHLIQDQYSFQLSYPS